MTKVITDTFEIYPALDVSNGLLARVPDSEFDSVEAAISHYDLPGINWIHLVDLDLAYQQGSNYELIQAIITSSRQKIQLSGGIRNRESFEHAVAIAPDRINVAPDYLADKSDLGDILATEKIDVSVAIDLDGEQVVSRASGLRYGSLANEIEWLASNGCSTIVVTDALRDGTMQGVRVDFYSQLVNDCGMNVIASGGISSIEEILQLRDGGVRGVVVGTALQYGRFTLSDAIEQLGRG